MVSEHDLGTWCGMIFMRTIIQGPPLDIETKSAFVEEGKESRRRRQFFEKTMTVDEKGNLIWWWGAYKNHGTYIWRHDQENY